MNSVLDSFEVFPWNPNLKTGITIIDEQHKKLVDLINQLANTLVSDNNLELTRIFDELTNYAKYHFETEEAIWSHSFGDDPWLISHQKTHTSFLPAIAKLKESYKDKPLREIIEHIVKFLIHWLTFHIIDNDKRMAIVIKHIETGTSLTDAKKISEVKMSSSEQTFIDTVHAMYDELSSRTLDLMRERLERIKVEEKLSQANSELEKLSITDQLTGLFNRRHFNEVFEQELRRATREKRYLTFMMLDIDHFKQLNDHYGHVQGDTALIIVGMKLKELCLRPGDFVFRLGGEEFGILITDQTSVNGNVFAEMIRTEIEALNIPNINSSVSNQMTVSVGIITTIPDSTDTVESYMHNADTLLYSAKEHGRNQVVNFEKI